MTQIERLSTKITECKLKIEILEQLPGGDLEPSVCNVERDPPAYKPHAWLNYYGNLLSGPSNSNTFERLEAEGFEYVTPILVQWSTYSPVPHPQSQEEAEKKNYELTNSWPMCPLWVDLYGNSPTAIAFYMYGGSLYRVGVQMPRGLISTVICDTMLQPYAGYLTPKDKWKDITIPWSGGFLCAATMHPETWISKRTCEADIYWEYTTDETMSPAQMFEVLIK